MAHPFSTTQGAIWVAVTSTVAGTTMKVAKQKPYPDPLWPSLVTPLVPTMVNIRVTMCLVLCTHYVLWSSQPSYNIWIIIIISTIQMRNLGLILFSNPCKCPGSARERGDLPNQTLRTKLTFRKECQGYRLSHAGLMRTNVKFTATHWSLSPGRPTVLQTHAAAGAQGRASWQVCVL